MSVSLRAWEERDVAALARIRADGPLQAQLMSRPQPNDVREWLLRRSTDPRGAFFVIDDGGECAGFVQLTNIERGGAAFVGVCVAPAWQGRGLGAQAMKLIEAHAAQTYDVRLVKLTVLASNVRAIALYERLGYRRVAAAADTCLMEKAA
jgi:RimJ/RimL family protein N-acetyltransferase